MSNARRRPDDDAVSSTGREHEEFLAAYRAWEAASDACYAKIVGGMNGASLDRDLAAIGRLHAEWLKKSKPIADRRSDHK